MENNYLGRVIHLEKALTKAIDYLYGDYDRAGFNDKFELARYLVKQRDFNKSLKKNRESNIDETKISNENRNIRDLMSRF